MRVAIVVVSLTFAALGARYFANARAARKATPPIAANALRIPHVAAAITIDGDTDDLGWLRSPGPARTGEFVLADGAPARPYSEARLVWGDGQLYLALYAADEDIKARTDKPDGPLWMDDSFRVTFTRGSTDYVIEVAPNGALTDGIRRDGGTIDYSWSSGAHVSFELDGTTNVSTDTDEEWLIEMAIPLDALGLRGESGDVIGLAIRRCDVPKDGARVCGAWGEGSEGSEGRQRGQIVLQ